VDDQGNQCDNIAPVVGITSTPVIDCAKYTMYVVAKTMRVDGQQISFHYRLYALDIATRADRGTVEIQGSVPGASEPNRDGHVWFDPHWHLNRASLLLLEGIVYVAFGGHCDSHPGIYHGWVFGYDAATLQRIGIFCTTPNAVGDAKPQAGVWQGGMGLAADQSNFIYLTTGNGDFNPDVADYGDSVTKLDSSSLSVSGFFSDPEDPNLHGPDYDHGSGGVLILPDPPTGLLVTCGKLAKVLLINGNHMGNSTLSEGLVQQFWLNHDYQPPNENGQPGVWGGPAYYGGVKPPLVYYCGNLNQLRAFALTDSGLLRLQGNHSSDNFTGEGGTTPNVSSNGQIAGSGIVWAIARCNPSDFKNPCGLELWAYDAEDLTRRLAKLDCGPWNNPHGGAMIEPTTIGGRVYVPSYRQVTVFGL
jgi:hypothetical protein